MFQLFENTGNESSSFVVLLQHFALQPSDMSLQTMSCAFLLTQLGWSYLKAHLQQICLIVTLTQSRCNTHLKHSLFVLGFKRGCENHIQTYIAQQIYMCHIENLINTIRSWGRLNPSVRVTSRHFLGTSIFTKHDLKPSGLVVILTVMGGFNVILAIV